MISLGDIGINGTAYVNINTGSPFESVIATTGTTTFEIDNVAYGTASVPDGGLTAGLLGRRIDAVYRHLLPKADLLKPVSLHNFSSGQGLIALAVVLF